MRKQYTKNRQASLDETFNPIVEFDPNEFPKFLKLDAVSAIKSHATHYILHYNELVEKGVA